MTGTTGGSGPRYPTAAATLSAAREHRVRSGEVDLCVLELGDRAHPTVVLVHGYPDSKEVWSPVVPGLVERGHHVVLYDVRGHGRSSAPHPLRGGFTLEKLTDDFLAVVDAVSPDAPVHLVGHDWGSVQGWEFATVERTRGRIASFTTLSGPSLDHFGHWIRRHLSRPTPRRAGHLLGQGLRSWYVYALHTPVLPEAAWRGPLGSRWPRMLARAEKLPEGDYPTASLPSDAAHGAWLYRDNVRPRLRAPRDAHAHCPVQLITPTGDAFLSPHLYDDLDRWAPDLVRRTSTARHWLPRSRPDHLARWVGDFVAAVGARQRADTPAGADEAEGAQGAQEEGGKKGAEGAREAGVGGVPPSVPSVPSASPPVVPRAPGTARRAARGSVRPAHAERFAGQLVLVTGAASGIGRATALAFARCGARVVAVDRDAEGAARTAEQARALGSPQAWAQTADVGDGPAMEKLAERVTACAGVVDILVNNAGIGLSGPFLDTSVEDWRRVLDVNLWGVIHGCRTFGRLMAQRRQGGHIVNTASAAAYQPSRALPAYSTSKAAVLMLSECLRAELAGQGIGVTAVCPGVVDTAITSTARFAGASPEEERRLRERVSRLYARRGYPPEKVADAVLQAVCDNRAVIPVTPEARGARALSRLAPSALRALARLNPPL